MKNITVLKIFPYDPTFHQKYDRYDGYALSTLQFEAPQVTEDLQLHFRKDFNQPIICSNLLRSKQTAQKIADRLGSYNIESLKTINEVKFDLNKLLSKKEFNKSGSNLVRKRFINCFIEDNLTEKRENIKKRIHSLLSYLETLPDGNYLVISHSFFMKILETYLTHKNLFEKPEILKQTLNYHNKTYNFGEGFSFTL